MLQFCIFNFDMREEFCSDSDIIQHSYESKIVRFKTCSTVVVSSHRRLMSWCCLLNVTFFEMICDIKRKKMLSLQRFC